jgi:hypothetical protein
MIRRMIQVRWAGNWRALVGLAALMLVVGCDTTGRPVFLRNPDPALQKTATQFAADAATRFPYKAGAPRGDAKAAPARAEVHYSPINMIGLVNLSETTDYADVEVWVNQQFVVFLPKMEKKTMKELDFKMLYDKAGNPLAITEQMPRVEKVELYMGGKMYDVPVQIAD